MEILGYIGYAGLCFVAITWAWGVRVTPEVSIPTTFVAFYFMAATATIPIAGVKMIHSLWVIPCGFALVPVSMFLLRIPVLRHLINFPAWIYRILLKLGQNGLRANVAVQTCLSALEDERRQQSIFMDSDIYWKQPILSGLIALKSSDLTPMYHSLSDDEVKEIAYNFWARSPTTDAGRDMIKLVEECEELQSVAPMKAVIDDPNFRVHDDLL